MRTVRKLHVPAVTVVMLLGLSWIGGGAAADAVDARDLARELRAAGLALDAIETAPPESDRQEVTASGPGLRMTIARFGSPERYRQWEGMLRSGPGGRPAAGRRIGDDGAAEQVGVFVKEPFVIVAVWAAGDDQRAAQVRRALGAFEEIGS